MTAQMWRQGLASLMQGGGVGKVFDNRIAVLRQTLDVSLDIELRGGHVGRLPDVWRSLAE